MAKIYLFDWGDTLMVDFPDAKGKMCDWPVVEAVKGAEEALAFLSKRSNVYVATNAAESTESDIKLALKRVGLSEYVSGYFCKANLGFSKGTPAFYEAIVGILEREPSDVVMVGDSIEKDIVPALEAGLGAIWYNPERVGNQYSEPFKQIQSLRELCV